jgi:asparagine synthase (glutamine-hydrolysing)
MPVLSNAARKLIQYVRHGDFSEHPYLVQRRLFHRKQVDALFSNHNGEDPADALADARLKCLMEKASSLDPLNQVSFLEANLYMGNMLLRDSDQMSMANSLELRVPLVDSCLAARLLSVPGDRKGFGRISKLWLYQSYRKDLPEEIFTRRKMGFTLPFDIWLRGPLRKQVEISLRANPGGVWVPGTVSGIWRDFSNRKLDWSRPWALFVLSQWVAKHIEGNEPAASQ